MKIYKIQNHKYRIIKHKQIKLLNAIPPFQSVKLYLHDYNATNCVVIQKKIVQ